MSAAAKKAVGRLLGGGVFPPWRGDDQYGPSETDVFDLWRVAIDNAGLDQAEVLAAVDRWLATNAGARRYWPAPADVLVLARRPTGASPSAGCGRCSSAGLRQVALHVRDDADRPLVFVLSVHCDCGLGAHWAARRAEAINGGPERPAAMQLAQWLANARNRPSFLAAYVDPTPSQRKVGGVDRPLSPDVEHALRGILASRPNRRGGWSPPVDRTDEDDDGVMR